LHYPEAHLRKDPPAVHHSGVEPIVVEGVRLHVRAQDFDAAEQARCSIGRLDRGGLDQLGRC
jgi:hypothetical protein